MKVCPIPSEIKNTAGLDISLVRMVARAAKTEVRPSDNMATLIADNKFAQRLTREFLKNRLNISPQAPELSEACRQSDLVLEKSVKLASKKIGYSVLDFAREIRARQTSKFQALRSEILNWGKRLGKRLTRIARIQQSETISNALTNSRYTFARLESYSLGANDVNVFQKNLQKNLVNARLSLALKKADYASDPSAQNKHFLEIAEKQFKEITEIVKKSNNIARLKKAEIVKAQEAKLRNYLVVFLKRTNSKRTQVFSNKDLQALSAKKDLVLKRFAKDLLQTRALVGEDV